MTEKLAYGWEHRLFERLGFRGLLVAIAEKKHLLLFSLAVVLICYGHEIFGFSLRIDAEWYALGDRSKLAWIKQGRWGMFWLSEWMMATPVIPVMPVLLCVGGLAIGGCFWLAAMNRKHNLPSYLLLAVLISSPVYYFTNYFITLGYGVGIGCTFVGAATWMLMKKPWYCMPLIVVLYAWAVGIYQALLPVTAVAFGICLLDHALDRPKDYKFVAIKLLQYSVCLVAGFLLYQYILVRNLALFNVALDSEYLNAFTQLQLEPTEIMSSLSESVWVMLGYYFGSDAYYLTWHNMLYLNALVMFSIGLLVFSQGRGILFGSLMLCIFMAVLMVPLALLLMNNGVMPPRTQISVVWVLAGSVYLAARGPSLVLRSVLTILIIALVYQFAIVINRYSLASSLEWEHSKHLSLQLMSELNRQRPAELVDVQPKQIPLELIGTHRSTNTVISPDRDVVGASFFEWDGGSAVRVNALWQIMGVYDYRVATLDERRAVFAHSKAMPSWPQPGSVTWLNGVAVIKLGDYSPEQLEAICADKAVNSTCPPDPKPD